MNFLVIRFHRKGGTRFPKYDIVVTLSKKRNRSRFFEKIGFYSPVGLDTFAINFQRLGF